MYAPATTPRTRNAFDAAQKARAEAISDFWRFFSLRR